MALTEEQLDNLTAQFNLRVVLDPETREEKTFTNFSKAITFFKHELEFWQAQSGGLTDIISRYQSVLSSLEAAKDQPDENQARRLYPRQLTDCGNAPHYRLWNRVWSVSRQA